MDKAKELARGYLVLASVASLLGRRRLAATYLDDAVWLLRKAARVARQSSGERPHFMISAS